MLIHWLVVLTVLLLCVVLIGESWSQLHVAALLGVAMLGVAMSQLAFLAHEATHRGILATPVWNKWNGQIPHQRT